MGKTSLTCLYMEGIAPSYTPPHTVSAWEMMIIVVNGNSLDDISTPFRLLIYIYIYKAIESNDSHQNRRV